MTSISGTIDVTNLNRIYNDNYSYSLPKKVLEGFLSGKAFDHQQLYTEEETQLLHEDINAIYQSILLSQPLQKPLAVISAGSPGSGKTTKLRQDLETRKTKGEAYGYICPDDVCLPNQKMTYVTDVKAGKHTKEALEAGYTKWRPGSNAATHLILGNLIREKCAFYFGTTSTAPTAAFLFDFLKKQGYQIRVIHVTAPDQVRWESIKERDKTFIQTTEQDVKEKASLIPQRINDTFLKYADEIDFYYRDGVKKDAQLAATWARIKDSPSGILQIVNTSHYENIKTIHNAATLQLNRPDLNWDTAFEKEKNSIIEEGKNDS